MAVNEVSRHGPRNHLTLHRHPEMSLEVVEETLLILQESEYYSLLELVDTVPGAIQVKLSFQIDGFLTDPSQL